jgi:hypothetical protein
MPEEVVASVMKNRLNPYFTGNWNEKLERIMS